VISKTLLLTLAITGAAWSQDDRLLQVRLGLGSMPGIDESEVSGDGLVTTTVDCDPDTSLSLDLGLSLLWKTDSAFGYGVYLGGFRRVHTGTDDENIEVGTVALGASLGADLALFINPDLVVTAGPRLGLGFGYQAIDHGSWDDGSGGYASLALQTGIYATVGRGSMSNPLVIGLEAGIMGWSSSATQHYDDGTDRADPDVTNSGAGGYASLVVGLTL
jgi:hypothetical protein